VSPETRIEREYPSRCLQGADHLEVPSALTRRLLAEHAHLVDELRLDTS
jgi:hypothetical protein